MRRNIMITVFVGSEEIEILSRFEGILDRSKSDAIRFLLMQVVKMLQINPPLKDIRCQRCGRHISDLPSFDTAFSNSHPIYLMIGKIKFKFAEDERLMKTYRNLGDAENVCIGSSWECVNCVCLPDFDEPNGSNY